MSGARPTKPRGLRMGREANTGQERLYMSTWAPKGGQGGSLSKVKPEKMSRWVHSVLCLPELTRTLRQHLVLPSWLQTFGFDSALRFAPLLWPSSALLLSFPAVAPAATPLFTWYPSSFSHTVPNLGTYSFQCSHPTLVLTVRNVWDLDAGLLVSKCHPLGPFSAATHLHVENTETRQRLGDSGRTLPTPLLSLGSV